MHLTPLEIALLAGGLSTLTAVVVRLWMGCSFVKREECELMHQSVCRSDQNLERLLTEIREEFRQAKRIQFKMLRAVIVHLSLSPEEKERLLNMGGKD